MTKILFFFSFFLLIGQAPVEAASCQKNGTCKSRFEFQGDPLDFERESSRAHTTAFFTLNFALNRALETPFAQNYVGHLTKNERIIYTAATLTLLGFIKEIAYDPDGVSSSDMVSNLLGIGLAIPIEITWF
jgi:hypothetical protein